jgi:predicted Fe-Mo cluster-binding NifX family protein
MLFAICTFGMKIAIPVFENRISPRLDFAPGFGLYDIEGERITGSREISCEGWSDVDRASKLKGFGVDTLICGGLPGYLHVILKKSGINVIPWIAGNANDALSLFIRGQLNSGMVIWPGRGKRRRCKRGVKVGINNYEKRR